MSERKILRHGGLGCAALSLVAIFCVLSPEAGAQPLDKPACDNLTAEKQTLLALNVDQLMAKGADWAVAHLSADDLSHIRRYIEIEEQIRFRCTAPQDLIKLGKIEEEEQELTPPKKDGAPEDAGDSPQAGSKKAKPPAKTVKKQKAPASEGDSKLKAKTQPKAPKKQPNEAGLPPAATKPL